MDAQLTDIDNKASQQARRDLLVELVAEQSHLVTRLSEITMLLSPCLSSTAKVGETQTLPTPVPDFDRQAYAIGLIWRNPNISVRELAQKVGVAKSTLFLPSWADVTKFIRARKNVSTKNFKNHHLNKDEEE